MTTSPAQAIVDKQKWLDGISDAVQPIITGAFSNAGETGRTAKDLLNGVWLGHPLHPVITDVPIGAWTMSELFDLISAMVGGDKGLDKAADITLSAGVVAAVGAAITGITDWSDVHEPERRRMGTAHALINVAGLALNIGSLGLRLRGDGRNKGLARTLSAGGYLLAAFAAYIAGDLVYTMGQAVNRNAWLQGPDKFTDIGPADTLKAGEMQRFEVANSPVVVVKDADGIHAFGGTCSHAGCGLWEGTLEGHIVTCKCHGSQFDITDGSLIHGPATASVPSYQIREHDGHLQVRSA